MSSHELGDNWTNNFNVTYMPMDLSDMNEERDNNPQFQDALRDYRERQEEEIQRFMYDE